VTAAETLTSLFDVQGTVVVVTGGGSGFGRAIAQVLVESGATVVVADRDAGRLRTVAEDLGPLGAVETELVDVADAVAVRRLVDGTVERHGVVDTVFANAGIARGRGLTDDAGGLDAFDMDDWYALLDVNLHGVVHTARAAAVHMKRQRRGRIIVTASTAGLRQDPLVSYSYVVAKAAVINFVRQAALDLARFGVRVNAIAPGPFRTNIGGDGPIDPAVEDLWSAQVPLGRMGDPGEIRGLAVLLASEASSFMTGGVYPVDGGALLQSAALPGNRSHSGSATPQGLMLQPPSG
jgi:NAD(P)-dependent dehydrogenase (short-subunit alcohol dehydrogenase family)